MIIQNGIVYDKKTMEKLITKEECHKCNNRMADEIQKLKENFNEKMDEMKDGLSKDIKIALGEFKEDLDARYASKLVEKVVYSLMGVMALTIIYALINLVIIK